MLKVLIASIGREEGLEISIEDIETSPSFEAFEAKAAQGNIDWLNGVFLVDHVFKGKSNYQRGFDENQGHVIYNFIIENMQKILGKTRSELIYGISAEFPQLYIKPNKNIISIEIPGGLGLAFNYIYTLINGIKANLGENDEDNESNEHGIKGIR